MHLLKYHVFSQVWFNNPSQRNLVFDSYAENIDQLIEYMIKNHLDVDEYFKGIKKILLQSKQVHKRTR